MSKYKLYDTVKTSCWQLLNSNRPAPCIHY